MGFESEEPPNKKVKTDVCIFVNPKNKKQCKSLKSTQSKEFCTNHILYYKKLEGQKKHNNYEKIDAKFGKRIPCPLDGNHSCWEKELDKHLNKCTKGKMKSINDNEPWFEIDTNKGKTHASLNNVSEEMIIKSLKVIRNLKFDDIEEEILKDEVIQLERVANLVGGQLKHATQQSSLVSHMKTLLHSLKDSEKYSFCEFGCGRAELSRYSALSISKSFRAPNKVVLIDRGNNRMKFDKNIREESPETIVERYKCDIKDVNLKLMLKNSSSGKILAISKHLCGVATDLTLRCLKTTSNENKAAVIAMCCRHVCNSQDYINPSFIEEILSASEHKEDLTFEQFFKCITKISSYATCGTRENEEGQIFEEGKHFTNLNTKEREEMGFVARRIIDEGRLKWCKNNWSEKSKLVKYCDLTTTLENTALIVPF
ncbi:hypothetical protein QEN19_004066 [Hanseniaspora menglaensis]